MSSQSSGIHTPNNNSETTTTTTTSFTNKIDLSVYGSPVQIRQNRNVARRASSFIKMATEDHPNHPNQPEESNNHRAARLVRSDARRGSSFIKAMSEDFISDDSNKYFGKSLSLNKDQNIRRNSSFLMADYEDSSGRSSNVDIRRGSSFIRTQDDSLQSPKDIRRGSSFIRTSDDSIEDSPRLNMRRGSSFIRMISEDVNPDEMHSSGRLSSKPESRRGSGITKVLSDDSEDPRRSTLRRGSSFTRSEDQDEEPIIKTDRSGSDVSEKSRKSIDSNTTRNRAQRHSLESISEYKAQTFSSASLYPSGVDYSSLSSMDASSEISSDFAMRTTNNDNDDRTYVNSSLSYLSWIDSVNSDPPAATAPVIAEDNRSGEWNNFWTNYSNSRNDCFSSPYLCPSNSGEDLYSDSNSTQRGYTDLSIKENVILTVEEVTEALNCTQRLMEILKGAMKRSETEVILTKNDAEEQNFQNTSKEEKKKEENLHKPSSNSCIDVFLNHTGVADILKRVINKRREVIMPSSEESCSSKTSQSDWSIKK